MIWENLTNPFANQYEQYPITTERNMVNCACNDWINNFTKFSATLANYDKLLHPPTMSDFHNSTDIFVNPSLLSFYTQKAP